MAATSPFEFRKPEIGKTFVGQLRLISERSQDNFYDELEKATKQEETRQFFEQKVKRLFELVQEARRLSDLVREQVLEFDRDDHRRVKDSGESGGKPVLKLTPKWDDSRKVRMYMTCQRAGPGF